MSASITSGTYPRANRSTSGGLQRAAAAVWQALSSAGTHRAHAEMLRLAALNAHTDPTLARQLRAAARDLMLA